MLVALILDRLIQEKILPEGEIKLWTSESYTPDRPGHAWTLFHENGSGALYLIDAMWSKVLRLGDGSSDLTVRLARSYGKEPGEEERSSIDAILELYKKKNSFPDT